MSATRECMPGNLIYGIFDISGAVLYEKLLFCMVLDDNASMAPTFAIAEPPSTLRLIDD